MGTYKVVLTAVAIALAALFTAVAVLPSKRPPVAVKVMGFEPAGIFDDTGEMWMVKVRIWNQQAGRGRPLLYVKGDEKSACRVANRWSRLGDIAGTCALYGYGQHELLFLVPPRTDRCRVSLQWTHSHLKSGRLWWLAEELPALPRVRAWLWKLGTPPTYAPNSRWWEFTVEFSLPPTPVDDRSAIGYQEDKAS